MLDYADFPYRQSRGAGNDHRNRASNYAAVNPGQRLILHGREFDQDTGVAVFLTDSNGRTLEPLFITPGPLLKSSSLEFTVPESLASGISMLSVANRGCDYSFKRSNTIHVLVADTTRAPLTR